MKECFGLEDKGGFFLKQKRSFCVVLILLFSFILVSCKGIAISGKTENVPGYTKQQAMLVLGSERNRYQNILGKEIWNLPISGQIQKTYGAYFIEKNKEFVQLSTKYTNHAKRCFTADILD